MAASGQLPEDIKDALNRGVLKRMPLTFLPFVNQQLTEWEYLFPNEQRSIQRLIAFVAGLDAQQSQELFREVVSLEQRMNLHQGKFSTSEQTIENASLLARSPYFLEWRKAVQDVFDEADRHASAANLESGGANRLILIGIPRPLTVNSATAWQRWRQIGSAVNLDIPEDQAPGGVLHALLLGSFSGAGTGMPGLLEILSKGGQTAIADTWFVDSDRSLIDSLVTVQPTSGPRPVLLSYARLDRYRESFSHQMNTMQKDLTDADAVYDRLRRVDVLPWCPPEVAADPATREFVRALYLSGNGAVIFGNSFVEWAASEAFRRARPRVLAAKFGVRSKPKPFTGVAVFDNPDQINPLPAVDDIPGSSTDAQMLALYVWLAAMRFPEYQRSTLCVCVAESLNQAYVIGPPESPLATAPRPLSLSALHHALAQWIA
ncbi:MAG TPA: hypothetical protein VKB38_01380 [Terracidiphilus sp.]|nr:hypothetical protein [Terracidiphilus sp.]